MNHINVHDRQYFIDGYDAIEGEIKCYGTKNYMTKALVASVLSHSETTFHNVPQIGDVEITVNMLEAIGATIEYDKTTEKLTINPSSIFTNKIPTPQTGTNRVPILLLSALLHKFDEVFVPQVGGCDIGNRTVDFHLQAIEKFGGLYEESVDGFRARRNSRLKGTTITLNYPSVGATETCLYLSVLAEGYSTIHHAAIEPEIIELITMLRSMGAIIYTTSSRTLHIEGVKKLHGVNNYVNGDRIEAASWACLAATTNGKLQVNGFTPSTLGNFLPMFYKAGGGFEVVNANSMLFYRRKNLSPIAVETDVYPGFSTDWQQPFAIMLTQANGISVIHDTVYENRFKYLVDLSNLGVQVQLSNDCLGSITCRFKGQGHYHSALITGKSAISGGELTVPDLRAGLAYVIAGAIAKDQLKINAAHLIERGYGDIETKLKNVGLNIKKRVIRKEI